MNSSHSQNPIRSQEISMKSKITIWHTITPDLVKKLNWCAQMISFIISELCEYILVLLDLALEKNRTLQNLPLVSEFFIINTQLTYDKVYIIWKEIFHWFQKYKVYQHSTIYSLKYDHFSFLLVKMTILCWNFEKWSRDTFIEINTNNES